MLDLRIITAGAPVGIYDLPALLGREGAARELGDTIEALITFMDDLGGDPDLEDTNDREQIDERELTYSEWHTRGRKSGMFELSDTTTHDDDEDGDPAEDDNEDSCAAGDDEPVSGLAPAYRQYDNYGGRIGSDDDAELARSPAFADDAEKMREDFSHHPGFGA